jgi:hypothetical protein
MFVGLRSAKTYGSRITLHVFSILQSVFAKENRRELVDFVQICLVKGGLRRAGLYAMNVWPCPGVPREKEYKIAYAVTALSQLHQGCIVNIILYLKDSEKL